MLDGKLDEIIAVALSRPAHKQTSKKERHQSVVADIEGRHPVLNRVVTEVERALRAKERERERGSLGALSAELDKTLRRSRGERIEDRELR